MKHYQTKMMLLFLYFLVMPLSGSCQTNDIEKAILKYDFDDIAGEKTTRQITQQVTPQAVSETPKIDILSLLMSKAGKKEQKIINQVLKIGQEKKLINLEKIEKNLAKINMPAIMNLYANIRSLKLNKFDLKTIENVKMMIKNMDTNLNQIKKLPKEFGNLSFFTAMAKDQLANHSSLTEKNILKASALQNYTDTITNLAKSPDAASKEKVIDAKERIETLKSDFGNIVPVASKNGKGKVFITSDYGMRIHPVKKTKRFHSGVDLAGWKCKGWKVKAIGPGRVVKSGWESGYGYVVIISHEIDGKQYFSRYAHLKKASRLTTGKVAKKGDIVGYCNNSGISTGSHLHFEVRENSSSGQTLDPKLYLPDISVLK